jgi:hypothetical protein
MSNVLTDPKQDVTDAQQAVADVEARLAQMLGPVVEDVKQMTTHLIAANDAAISLGQELDGIKAALRSALDNWPGTVHPPVPPAPPVVSGGWIGSKGYTNPSALGWFSGITPQAGNGASDQIGALQAFRGGRPTDCMTLFQGGSQQKTWDDTVKTWAPGSQFQVGRDGPRLGAKNVRAILTIPFLNQGCAHDWVGLAEGKYRAPLQKIATYIKGYGLPVPIILRPCREFNDTGQPFGAEADRKNGFKNFKKGMALTLSDFADVLGRDNILISACVTKRGFQTLKDGWWDDDLIDIVDVDLYKTKEEPANSDPSNWTLYRRFIDDFVGLAAQKRKPMGFSEWGYHSAGGDAYAPYWFEDFFKWLSSNKVDVSHENYYNADNHVIFNPGGGMVDVPAGQKAYQQHWGS